MSDTLALEALYDAVVLRFADESLAPSVEHAFGWREPPRKTGGRRIVWVPGDDGDLGELAAPRAPGRNPRPLWTIHELATVYVEAFDTSAPESEIAQYRAVRLLFDAWLRAVYLAAHGTVRVVSMRYVDETANARRAGAAICAVIAIDAMVPDVELQTVTAASTTTVTVPDDTDPDSVTTTEDP